MTEKDRINRVITRSGDTGTSGLADGSRLPKDAPVFNAMGDIDELNAALGELRQRCGDQYESLLQSVQQGLFDIGAELAVPGTCRLETTRVVELEQHADTENARLPALREFILPGGNAAASWCHVCRTITRRAERSLVTFNSHAPVNPVSLQYLNRLSDLLFILARRLNQSDSQPEPQWQPATSGSDRRD